MDPNRPLTNIPDQTGSYGNATLQGQQGKDNVQVPLSTITQVISEHVNKNSNKTDRDSMSTFVKSLIERIKQTNPNIDDKQFTKDAGLENVGKRAA